METNDGFVAESGSRPAKRQLRAPFDTVSCYATSHFTGADIHQPIHPPVGEPILSTFCSEPMFEIGNTLNAPSIPLQSNSELSSETRKASTLPFEGDAYSCFWGSCRCVYKLKDFITRYEFKVALENHIHTHIEKRDSKQGQTRVCAWVGHGKGKEICAEGNSCQKSLKGKRGMLRHILTHQENNKHQCPKGCGASYSRPDALRRHEKACKLGETRK